VSEITRWLGLLFVAGIASGLWYNIDTLEFSTHQWLPDDNPTHQNKRYLDEEFNRGEHLFVVVRLREDYFMQDVLDELDQLFKALEDVEFIAEVNSPLHATTFIQDQEETLHSVSFKEAMESGLIRRQEYPQKLADSPYWLRLIDADARILVIKLIIDLQWERKIEIRTSVFRDVKALMAKTSRFQDYGFVGEAALNHEIDSTSRNDLQRILPLVAAALLLLLTAFYRNFFYVLAASTVTGLTLLLALNVNQWLGYSFNVLSSSLPVLIMTIAVADSIHIIKRWQAIIASEPTGNVKTRPLPALVACWKQTWRPCFFTSLTSATGFGTFHFSELTPLSQFGSVAFVAILLAWPTIMLGTLLMLYVFRPTSTRSIGSAGSLPIGRLGADRQGAVLGVAGLLVVVFVLSLPLARSETNFLEVFFDTDSSIRQTFDLVDDRLNGSGSAEIILRSDSPDTFKTLASFEEIQQQVSEASRLPEVLSVGSLLEPVEMVHKPLGGEGLLPTNEDALAQELLFLEFSRGDSNTDVLSDFVDFDYQSSRISLYTRNMTSSETEDFLARLQPILDKITSSYLLAGSNVYFYELSDYVLNAQFTSLLLMTLVVWLVFLVQFGLRIGIAGTLASLMPILITVSLQILLGIPFDFSTVMVASVSMGLAIDNSIHYLHRFNFHRSAGAGADASHEAATDTWQPITLTTLILIVGFLLLTQSELVLIDRFSVLVSTALLLSLPATFLLLPALLNRLVLPRRSSA